MPRHPRGFLYRQVAAELRRRIDQGVYTAGARIPSESALVQDFGVSAITIRRAIMELMFEGVLYGRQGLGVFVADRRKIVRVLSGAAPGSMGDEIRRVGLVPSIRELSFERIQAGKELADCLSLRTGATVYRHKKLVFADDEPVALDTVFLKRSLADRLRGRLGSEFAFSLVSELGIELERTDFRFEGTAASEHQAEMLNLAPRAPLVVVHYVLYDTDHRPVIAGYTISRSDRMVFELSSLRSERDLMQRTEAASPRTVRSRDWSQDAELPLPKTGLDGLSSS